jgi:hypothetical protein
MQNDVIIEGGAFADSHVIEEVAGTERRSAETVIRDARNKLVSEMCPAASRVPRMAARIELAEAVLPHCGRHRSARPAA